MEEAFCDFIDFGCIDGGCPADRGQDRTGRCRHGGHFIAVFRRISRHFGMGGDVSRTGPETTLVCAGFDSSAVLDVFYAYLWGVVPAFVFGHLFCRVCVKHGDYQLFSEKETLNSGGTYYEEKTLQIGC